jgi:hypothetical protein
MIITNQPYLNEKNTYNFLISDIETWNILEECKNNNLDKFSELIKANHQYIYNPIKMEFCNTLSVISNNSPLDYNIIFEGQANIIHPIILNTKNTEIIDILFHNNINLNSEARFIDSFNNYTPIDGHIINMLAAQLYPNHEIIKKLLSLGVDTNILSSNQLSFRDIIKNHPDQEFANYNIVTEENVVYKSTEQNMNNIENVVNYSVEDNNFISEDLIENNNIVIDNVIEKNNVITDDSYNNANLEDITDNNSRYEGCCPFYKFIDWINS